MPLSAVRALGAAACLLGGGLCGSPQAEAGGRAPDRGLEEPMAPPSSRQFAIAEMAQPLLHDYITRHRLEEHMTPAEMERYVARFMQACQEEEQRLGYASVVDGSGLWSLKGDFWRERFAGFLQSQLPAVTERLVNSVNSKAAASWVAQMPHWGSDFTMADAKVLMGYIRDNTVLEEGDKPPEPVLGDLPETSTGAPDSTQPPVDWGVTFDGLLLPTSFDSREKWEKCAETIAHVRDQGKCGSCWAQATAQTMDGRLCISSDGSFSGPLGWVSAGYITSCYNIMFINGCFGGNPHWAMSMVSWGWFGGGSPTGSEKEGTCQPYFGSGDALAHFNTSSVMRAPRCPKKCADQSPEYSRKLYQDKFCTFGSPISTTRLTRAAMEVYENGPAAIGFVVYRDFMSYKSGYYVSESYEILGGHATTMIGWKKHNGTIFIQSVNSWGTKWGDDGLFFMHPDCCEVVYHIPSTDGRQKALPLPTYTPPATEEPGLEAMQVEPQVCLDAKFPHMDAENRVCRNSTAVNQTAPMEPCGSWCAYDPDYNPCDGCCGPLVKRLCKGSKPSTCSDSKILCAAWAKHGECEKNKDWMEVHCQRACGICEPLLSTSLQEALLDAPLADLYQSGKNMEIQAKVRVVIAVEGIKCSCLSQEARYELTNLASEATVLGLQQPFPEGRLEDVHSIINRVTLLPCFTDVGIMPDDDMLGANFSSNVQERLREVHAMYGMGPAGIQAKAALNYMGDECGFLPETKNLAIAFSVTVPVEDSTRTVSDVNATVNGPVLWAKYLEFFAKRSRDNCGEAISVSRTCVNTDPTQLSVTQGRSGRGFGGASSLESSPGAEAKFELSSIYVPLLIGLAATLLLTGAVVLYRTACVDSRKRSMDSDYEAASEEESDSLYEMTSLSRDDEDDEEAGGEEFSPRGLYARPVDERPSNAQYVSATGPAGTWIGPESLDSNRHYV
eukprot:TRINITY_DN30743_c0_g1_i1.p1 TRINITY_DN30743_c0_g1~~TRINITY_DN30743_c0_g1_i1.p1  ORF type:complete len:953 (-),score=171.91 TRINITY_DN30743_c0_g1_i1:159-3017(-)